MSDDSHRLLRARLPTHECPQSTVIYNRQNSNSSEARSVVQNNHVCVENSMRQNCPVCFEYLFDSVRPTAVLPCGHTIHSDCLREMEHNRSGLTLSMPKPQHHTLCPSSLLAVLVHQDPRAFRRRFAILSMLVACFTHSATLDVESQ